MTRMFACLVALSFVAGPALAQGGKRDRVVILRNAELDAPREGAAKWHEIRQRIERLQKEIQALRERIHGGLWTLDFDHDGDMDLFIVNRNDGPDRLMARKLRRAPPGKRGKRGHRGPRAPFPARIEIEIEIEMEGGEPRVEVDVEFGDDKEGEHKRGRKRVAVAKKKVVTLVPGPPTHVKLTGAARQPSVWPGVVVQPGGITYLRPAPSKAKGGIDVSAKRVLELAAKLKIEERKAKGLLDSRQYAKASLSANHAAKLAKMLEEAKKNQARAKKAHKGGFYMSTTTGPDRLGKLEQRIDRIEKLLKKLLAKKSK